MTEPTRSYPRGPLKNVYYHELEEFKKYHFEFTLTPTIVLGNETKMGIAADFIGDVVAGRYAIVAGYRYSPPISNITLPNNFHAGVAIKKFWGDYQLGLFTELPQLNDKRAFEDNWRFGVFAKVNYDLYTYDWFRFGFTGEVGLSTGRPSSIVSHMIFGVMVGFGQ